MVRTNRTKFSWMLVSVVLLEAGLACAAEPVFQSPGYLAGKVSVDNKPKAGTVTMLSGSKYGTLATLPSGSVNVTDARLTFDNVSGSSTKRIELTTSANPYGKYKSAWSLMNTAREFNGEPRYVDVYLKPTSGEKIGKPITVWFDASYQNTNTAKASGYNFVQVSVMAQNKQADLLIGQDNVLTPGGKSANRSGYWKTTVGSSFRIAMVSYSSANQNSAVGARVKLNITVK